jgi:glycosyltransferase involved in cell wall biosynthesis/ribosomal protein S18 acetylase RimI-like enzyme
LLVAHLTTVDLSLRFLILPQLEAVTGLGGEAIGISAPGSYSGDLEALGIEHIPLRGATRGLTPIADIRAGLSLWRTLRQRRPDVLHTHTPKPGVYGRVLGRLAGVPVVMNTVHGLYAAPDDPVLKRLVVYAIEGLAARFSDLELIQSREDYELVIRWRITRPDRTILLGNGVDLVRFDRNSVSTARRDELRREIGAGPEDVVVGSVGRLVREKGFAEIFEAAAELRDECLFVVLGPDEPDKADGLTRADLDRASANGVHLLGMRDNVEEWLAAMDVFVLASHREGFPRAAMEAAAMGLPVVATDIRGCREVVDHNVTGLLTPVGDPSGLVASIRSLVSSPRLRRDFGTAGAKKAQRSFDEATVVETVISSQVRALRETGRFHRLKADGATPIEIRAAVAGDVPVIASLHRTGIATGFLPTLGLSFLRHLYAAMLGEPGSIVLVAEDKFGPIAFVAGVADVRSFYGRFLRTKGLRAGLSVARRLVRPSVWRRALETAHYDAEGDDVSAELLAMAVAEPYRGRGIGRELAAKLLDDFSGDGIEEVKVVVATPNESARRLYSSVGFQDVHQIEIHRGEPSRLMVSRRRGGPAPPRQSEKLDI